MTELLDEEEDRTVKLRMDGENAKRLLALVRPHLPLFVATFLVLLAVIALELAGPWLLREVIDGPIARRLGGETTAFSDFAPWLIAYLAVFGFSFLGHYWQVILATTAGQGVVRDLRVRLFGHLLHLSPDYYDRAKTGRLVTRIASDCESLSELFTTGVVTTIADLLKIVGLFAACFWVSPELTLTILLASPPLILVVVVFYGRARRAYRQVRKSIARTTGWFAEAMQGVRLTRMFAQEQRVFDRYADLSAETRSGWIRTVVLFGLFFAFVEVCTGMTQALLLWPAAEAIPKGALTFGGFVQFWAYFGRMVQPIRELGEKYNIIQSAFASGERVFRILDEEATLPLAKDPTAPRSGNVRFDHVYFHYNAEAPVLHDVTFEIERGSHIAVVGPTGTGKTTLIQLLSRFRDPISGSITIDGQDLRDLDLHAHRARIGIVLQDVFLFASNILENVRLHDATIPEERVVRALEAVQAGDLVRRAGGLHAQVQERGATLSQGERQLLAFARALVFDPEILVLDEATANVDTPTERRIQEAMRVAMRGRTTLVIAHRLSTVREADRILVLEAGRLVEQGSHADLLAADGAYAKLARTFAEEG